MNKAKFEKIENWLNCQQWNALTNQSSWINSIKAEEEFYLRLSFLQNKASYCYCEKVDLYLDQLIYLINGLSIEYFVLERKYMGYFFPYKTCYKSSSVVVFVYVLLNCCILLTAIYSKVRTYLWLTFQTTLYFFSW